MSSVTLVSIEEYVATTYRPDCDFLNGELQERNLGELEHSLLQTATGGWFWIRKDEWKIVPLVEQRVQVTRNRFRVPDITILHSDQKRESIITIPPLILIEILSKDDTLRGMRERVDDYLNFGVSHVWILDPAVRRAYVCSRTAFREPENGELAVSGTPIRIALADLFSQIEAK